MGDAARITDILAEMNILLAGVIVSDSSRPDTYFVPLRLARVDGRRSPSGRTLASARSSLEKLGFTVDFILIDNAARDIESNLRTSLLVSFPDDIRNSFFTQEGPKPQAWIQFKRSPAPGTIGRLEAHLRQFADLFSLKGLAMVPIVEANTATKTEILSLVRQLAPVDVATLARELARRGHDVPSPDWTKKRLDALRKSNLVLRRADGGYVLTAEALARLGTRKNARSPDVSRLLALARRGA